MDNPADLSGEFVEQSSSMDEANDANLQLLLKKRAQDRRRQVKSHWFEQFPWLQLDRERGLFFCCWCIAASKINTMTRGKSAQMPKKHYFQQHELHSEHQSAAQQFWRSVATTSSKTGCPSESQPYVNGEAYVTRTTPNSSLRLNVALPDTPINCPDVSAPSTSFASSYDYKQASQSVNESYSDPPVNQTFLTNTSHANAVSTTSPVASWQHGLDVDARNPVSAIDQSAIITSDVIAGLLDTNLTPKGTRKIKPAWFTAFPWLVMDGVRQLFFCQYCCAANKHNIFTDGRTTANPKKDHFYKHVQTADHTSAAVWYQENCTQATDADVSLEMNLTDHVGGNSEFVSGSHTNGSILQVTVKQEVMPSEEVEDGSRGDSGAQHQRETATDLKVDPYDKEIGHSSVGLSDPVDEEPTNTAQCSSMDWCYDAASIAQFLQEFVWLEYTVRGLMKCTACECARKQNSFSYGQHPGSVTHKRLVMHERLPGHADAICTLGCTLRKDTSSVSENTPSETSVIGEGHHEGIHIQPSSGDDDITEVMRSGSANTMLRDDESSHNECETTSTVDNREELAVGNLPAVIDVSTLQDNPAAVTGMLMAGWGHRVGHRNVRPAWFFQFPWLQYDVSRNCFRCKCCAIYSSISNFAIGKSVSMPKRHTFVSHEASDGHCVALKAYNADARNTPLSCGSDTISGATELMREAENYTEQWWHSQFPWVRVDFDQMELHCRVCRSSDDATVWESSLAVGVPLSSVCLEDLDAHKKSEAHRKSQSPTQDESRLPTSSLTAMPVVMKTARESLSYSVDQPRIETTENTWMADFWQLANQLRHLNVLCDVTLTVAPHDGKCMQHEFRAHRLMLVCASDLFKTTLSSGKDHFHFNGVSPAGMKAVLDFIYGQPVHGTRSEYVDYYNAATELCVLPARTAFSKVMQNMGSESRSTGQKTVSAAATTDGNCNPRNCPQTVRMEVKTGTANQLTERLNRNQAVDKPLLSSSSRTPISKLIMRDIFPSSISCKTNPTCKRPAKVLPVGNHLQKKGKPHVATLPVTSGTIRYYRCTKPKCRRKFTRQSDLMQHLAYVHIAQKRHRCNWCGTSFLWRTSLQAHVASHVTDAVSMVT